MKAICTKGIFRYEYNYVFEVDEGEVVDYTVRDKRFVIGDAEIPPTTFFNHFKVIEGKERMTYSDFEYILCNYVFGSAVLWGDEYNGIRHLVIQDMFKGIIMIAVNKGEDVIRVSFDDKQEKYTTYEEALDGIKNWRQGK
jgi:hypothetical protein